jgi:hypothetical protein
MARQLTYGLVQAPGGELHVIAIDDRDGSPRRLDDGRCNLDEVKGELAGVGLEDALAIPDTCGHCLPRGHASLPEGVQLAPPL